MNSIHVFAPASVANAVCGFDVLGFAVHEPGDEVILRLVQEPGVRIKAIHGDEGKLPLDPTRNTVSAVIINYLQRIKEVNMGIEIELFKKMPIGSGLGSSAASTIAGLFAIHHLSGQQLSQDDLLQLAIEGENLACGQGHADNVAPALLGGFVLIRSYHPLDVIKLNTPADLVCSLIHPQIEIQTRDARSIIKKSVSLKDAVIQMGNVGGMITGLFQQDYELISRSMEDVIIEPTRSILIPGFYKMKELALRQGALGFGISGSGPSVFALSKDEEIAGKIVRVVKEQLLKEGIQSEGYVSRINQQGPKILG
ncbi:MAG: homoserine kinase [Chitinophagaceae bacterium]